MAITIKTPKDNFPRRLKLKLKINEFSPTIFQTGCLISEQKNILNKMIKSYYLNGFLFAADFLFVDKLCNRGKSSFCG